MATQRKRKPKAEKPSTLESRLGLRFRKPELLALALTHSSFMHESRVAADARAFERGNDPGSDNEQMEFLGDAVLGLIVTEVLYSEFPQCNEGALTRMRASLVGRPHLVKVALDIGIGERLCVGRSAELTGVAAKPAVLADAVEALIAAIYIDSGLPAARKFVERFVIAPEREALQQVVASADHRGPLRDAKSLLQEMVQAQGLGRLRYLDTAQSGPAHQRSFAVEAHLESMVEGNVQSRLLGSAEGHSKKEAQQAAAQQALDNWPSAPLDEAQASAA